MLNPEKIALIAARRRESINKLQGIKSDAYSRAEELYNEKQAQKKTNELNMQEREITQDHPLDLFVTPPELARRMVQLADIKYNQSILEPSAGTGKIAEAIRQAGYNPVCIELNYRAAKLLQERGYNVLCMDFLDHNEKYDRIIMNPPFSNEIKHVKHAYDLLNIDGRIIAIMSEGIFFRTDKKHQDFREFLEDHGTSEILPPGTFKTSGTMINARLVIIDK